MKIRNYKVAWYWWLLMFMAFPVGWLVAAVIWDDINDPAQKEWEDQMNKILKDSGLDL